MKTNHKNIEISHSEAVEILQKFHKISEQNGTSNFSLDEINQEITAAKKKMHRIC